MKLDMRHEPIILPRLIVVLIVAALGVLGVEVSEGQFLGVFNLGELLSTILAAGTAYLAEGFTRRAFTDSPATVERVYTDAANAFRSDNP